jgi:hypothetical protein
MLDYLKDQGNTSEPKNQENSDHGNKEQQEYLTVANKSQQLHFTNILLIVLFVAGLVMLFFMIKKTTPNQAQAADATEEVKLEMAISRLTGVRSEMYNKMDEIIAKFYEFSEVKQVKVNELAKNPFIHDSMLGDIDELLLDDSGKLDPEAVRIQKLKKKAENLELLSILKSNEPGGTLCMLNDRFLAVGQSIEGFEVTIIDKNQVTLECDDIKVVLKLGQ